MLAAIVPVKSLNLAKGRLAALLTPEERAGLCLAMLADVLRTLAHSTSVGLLAVTSPDPVVARRATELGARFWPDTAGSLSGAVAAALSTAAQHGATAALVLPCDVPLVTPADVDTLWADGCEPGSVVVAPTGDGGTGALLLHPPQLIAPDYGGASAARHLAAAQAAGVRALLCSLPHLALDLDRPADLADFWRLSGAGEARGFLRQLRRKYGWDLSGAQQSASVS